MKNKDKVLIGESIEIFIYSEFSIWKVNILCGGGRGFESRIEKFFIDIKMFDGLTSNFY